MRRLAIVAAVAASGLSMAGTASPASEPIKSIEDWWVPPPPGVVRVFYDINPPTRLETIPIDGIPHWSWSGGGSEEPVGALWSDCSNSLVSYQTGRIYPHTSYNEVYTPC